MREYLTIAEKAARSAGTYLFERKSVTVEKNLERDIKLANDKESECIIIEELGKTGLSILTEERGLIEGRGGVGPRWIVDPLDGSVNYLRGIDELTCISIALFDGNAPLLGVIYRYAANEMFAGIVGEGSYLNGEPIKTSSTTRVKEAILATGLAASRDYSEEALREFSSCFGRFKKVRMLGAAAVMGAFVSCGRFDAYIEDDIKLWDVASAMAIITAAGGVAEFVCKTDKDLVDFKSFATMELKGDFYA